MGLSINNIYQGDCVRLLNQLEPGSIDIAFADPPFNIGYEYDIYHDAKTDEEYLSWSSQWMKGIQRALKPNGVFWLAIGDEYAAELKLIAQRECSFTCRSWVIWYYTFGVNCTRMFSRSHTHLLYLVKNPKKFVFHPENPAIRIPSARQLVYADNRANPRGRLPDNTWIYRPQDVSGGFAPDHDTWYFPRVAGTFKERQGFHGCQMPEQLLGRIIRCCSNPMDIVLDPFGGSGTTYAVAKKLGRKWIGFELSEEYVSKISLRLDRIRIGDPLDGAANPLTSAPASAKKANAPQTISSTSPGRRGKYSVARRQRAKQTKDYVAGIIDAYKVSHKGFSVDHLLADKELNASFQHVCRKNGLPGDPVEWNLSLLRIRKRGRLPRSISRIRTCTFNDMDSYSFASEVALQLLSVECEVTLDGMLCDPKLAERFDEIAKSFAPGHSSFEYRWAALAVRKRACKAKILAKSLLPQWRSKRLPRSLSISSGKWSEYPCPGVYLINGLSNQWLYVGATVNLEQRINLTCQIPSWNHLNPNHVTPIPAEKPFGLQSALIGKFRPAMNSHLLMPDIEAAV